MRIPNVIFPSTLALLLMLAEASAATWQVRFDSNNFGPVDMIAEIEQEGDTLKFEAPGLAFDLTCVESRCEGLTGGGNPVNLTIEGGQVRGSIDAGLLEGAIIGETTNRRIDSKLRDYVSIADDILRTLEENVFDPNRLETDEFSAFETAFRWRARRAHNDWEFIQSLRDEWRNTAPFSHVQLARTRQPVAELAVFFDGMRLGYDVARLEWQGNVAVLTVDSMMGNDTIEQIDAAFEEIATRGAEGLIIDLRTNGGGAFAVRPLVGHVIDTPFDAGIFLSRRWTENYQDDPTALEIEAEEPWAGWSISAFWADLLEHGILRLRFVPDTNNFDGPVMVLVSSNTASAAELAVDAFKTSGLVTIIGEQTAGEMLSQTMFDVAGGYQLSLPIADYISSTHGRIEGAGVTPDIAVAADEAMDVALQMLSED